MDVAAGSSLPRRTGRLFAALWPDAAVRHAFAGWQASMLAGGAGRATPCQDLHATLVFIGDQDAEQLPVIAAALDLRGPRSTLVFDKVERWQRGLVVAVPTMRCEALTAWQAALAARLQAAGVAIDDRPYRLHVTLARAAADLPSAAVPPITWSPTGHVLAVRKGAHYRVLHRYP